MTDAKRDDALFASIAAEYRRLRRQDASAAQHVKQLKEDLARAEGIETRARTLCNNAALMLQALDAKQYAELSEKIDREEGGVGF